MIEGILKNPENTKTIDNACALMRDIGGEYVEKTGSMESLRFLRAFINAWKVRTIFMENLLDALKQRLEKES